jgi:hypothetical protein
MISEKLKRNVDDGISKDDFVMIILDKYGWFMKFENDKFFEKVQVPFGKDYWVEVPPKKIYNLAICYKYFGPIPGVDE